MGKIVWIDMEMSGLDVRKDKIMEIACLVTDDDLNVLAELESIVINQPDSVLEAMNEWCTTTHTKVHICVIFKLIPCYSLMEFDIIFFVFRISHRLDS